MSSHDCLSNYHSHYWNSGGISHRSSTNLQSSTKLELRLSQKFSISNSSRFLSRHYSVSLEAADEKINSVFFSRNRMEAMWESCVIVFTRWSRTIYNNEKNESEEGRERWVSLTQSEIGRLNHSFSIYLWATRSRNDEEVLCCCVHRRHLPLTRLTVSQDQNHAETARGQKEEFINTKIFTFYTSQHIYSTNWLSGLSSVCGSRNWRLQEDRSHWINSQYISQDGSKYVSPIVWHVSSSEYHSWAFW